MKKANLSLMFLSALLAISFALPPSSAYAGAKPEGKKEEKKAEGGGRKKAPLPTDKYVQLDPIILPVLQRDGVQQVISMVVVIEAKSPDKAQAIKDMKPKLADAFLSDMYGAFSRPSSMDNGIIKISELKTRMVQIANKILGPDIVEDVLLQVLQQRPA